MIHPVKMNFLREFPFVLGKKHRIQFLAAAYVGDVIFSTYSELFNVVSELSNVKDQSHIDTGRRNQVFRLSWEIVEHADSIYNLMKMSGNLFTKTPGYSELEHHLKCASPLRNKKIHLFQNIDNLSKRKKLNYLHGVVKWTHDPRIERSSSSYLIKVLTIEPMTHEVSFNAQTGIDTIKQPVDNIILEARENTLNITRFVSAFLRKTK